ncbi:MAG: hypothetical protein ABIP55_12800, partial [Tepidisphaeraceae bacterium]
MSRKNVQKQRDDRAARTPCVQPLEKRLLMAVTPALADLKQGPLAKVGSALAAAWMEFSAHGAAAKAPTAFHSSDRLLHQSRQRVAIEAYSTGDGAALAD